MDAPPKPVAAYVPVVRSGSLVFVSGQLPIEAGRLMARGLVGREVDVEAAKACARQCAINGLAQVRAELGTLDGIARVVRVGCWVACEAGFGDHPKVGNGASELLFEVFGERGKHARASVGSPSLPLNAPVEVEFVFELR